MILLDEIKKEPTMSDKYTFSITILDETTGLGSNGSVNVRAELWKQAQWILEKASGIVVKELIERIEKENL